MKTTKLMIVLICLVVSCVSVAWAEYKLLLYSGVVFGLFANTSVSVALLGALLRAPEGYEDTDGFHVRARPRRRVNRARHAQLVQLTRALKIDIARLFSNP
jgi:hypothetical protein